MNKDWMIRDELSRKNTELQLLRAHRTILEDQLAYMKQLLGEAWDALARELGDQDPLCKQIYKAINNRRQSK